mgnify:CR=1 FL=1
MIIVNPVEFDILIFRYTCPEGTIGSYVFVKKHGSGPFHVAEISVQVSEGDRFTSNETKCRYFYCIAQGCLFQMLSQETMANGQQVMQLMPFLWRNFSRAKIRIQEVTSPTIG